VKELRGAAAIRYAKERGLDFLIDESSLAIAEGRLQGKTVTMDDVETLFEAQLGELYDPVRIFEGTKGFHFLVDRYGDDWIYIPIEGNHPLEEEAAVLRLYGRKLNAKQPQGGGDILELASEHPPRLKDTGFPKDADPDLLFQAALRLVEKGILKSIPDRIPRQRNVERNYGNTYFFIPPDLEIPLADVLCNHCVLQTEESLSLHGECARRLRATLTNALRQMKDQQEL
jgi:hypothetical protein